MKSIRHFSRKLRKQFEKTADTNARQVKSAISDYLPVVFSGQAGYIARTSRMGGGGGMPIAPSSWSYQCGIPISSLPVVHRDTVPAQSH
jgi:hypothetical protein